MDNEITIKNAIKEEYGTRAVETFSQESQEKADLVARAFGYSPEELSSLPTQANMGLSCGNPIAFASLKEVGPKGRVIGIDMTPEMIELAKRNAEKSGYTNVQFIQVPVKLKAFKEIYRILKPGGRLAVSDIALKKALPYDLKTNLPAYVGCVAGALLIDDYKNTLLQSGFSQVMIVDMNVDLNVYRETLGCDLCNQTSSCCSVQQTTTSCCSSQGCENTPTFASILSQYNINEYAASCKIFAVKL